jgi:hypothetical protein
VSNNSSPGKAQGATSIIAHATRGIIRDRVIRRKTMFLVLVAALIQLFCGATFLQATLNPHKRPVLFVLFWIVCAWLTLTAMLLAIFDLLAVGLEARKAQREARQTFDRAISNQ